MGYTDYFNFEREPFSNAPNEKFYFNSEQHNQALLRLKYSVDLLVMIHSGITPEWLLSRICMQLGVKNPDGSPLKMLKQLYARLLQIDKEGRKAVVLIDEAQMLQTRELMEEFRTATDEMERVHIDKAVHDKIAEIGGNYLILILLNTISSLLESFIRDARGMILREESNRDLLLVQHQEICDGIIAKDSKRAIKAMKIHLETINTTMKKLHESQAAER